MRPGRAHAPESGPDGAGDEARVGRRIPRAVRLLAGGLLPVTALAIVGAWGWRAEPSPPASSRLPTLAVLPLENLSGDAAEDYFADGITDSLITVLAAPSTPPSAGRLLVATIRRAGSHWRKCGSPTLASLALLSPASHQVLDGALRAHLQTRFLPGSPLSLAILRVFEASRRVVRALCPLLALLPFAGPSSRLDLIGQVTQSRS